VIVRDFNDYHREVEVVKRIVGTLVVVALLSVCSLSQTSSQAPNAPPPETLDQKLGPDDGAALAILFGANLRGNLFPCD